MIDEKVLLSLEFNKIRSKISEYCVLYGGKEAALSVEPLGFMEAKAAMDETTEAYSLLYDKGVPGIEFYDDLGDLLPRAKKGATLSMGELLKVARFLKSANILRQSVMEKGEELSILYSAASRIYVDRYLENEIKTKILTEDSMSDNASEKLSSIRRQIKKLNEQIRGKLASFIHGEKNKFLQESIITR